MVKVPPKVKNIINAYLDVLKKRDIPIKQAVLFGSYTKGDYGDWSDMDMALVYDAFVGDRIQDRIKIRPITLSISCDIEVLPYTPRDFTPDNPFVKNILETGVRIV